MRLTIQLVIYWTIRTANGLDYMDMDMDITRSRHDDYFFDKHILEMFVGFALNS